ncbi:hypothetical protein PQ610_00930 [Tardisphaera miroshnichenkoae]
MSGIMLIIAGSAWLGAITKQYSTPSATPFSLGIDGIVYILPSHNSTPYWAKTYGDRIWFYVYANLSLYRKAISADFATIRSAGYDFVVIFIPLADQSYPYYYRNLALLNELASENGLKVMWTVLPKSLFGPEWTYLNPGSEVHAKLIEALTYMANLNSTYKLAVWYGWSPSSVPLGSWANVTVVQAYLRSLPQEVTSKYVVWIDQPYDEYVNNSGVAELLNELNVPVVTEEYCSSCISRWYDAFNEQYLTTGVWDAPSAQAYHAKFGGLVSSIAGRPLPRGLEPRILITWIYWDVNDGSGELYRALTPTGLANPLVWLNENRGARQENAWDAAGGALLVVLGAVILALAERARLKKRP